MPVTTVSAEIRDLFVREWLACTLRTATQTGRCLRDERDPFRNPVGHTLRAAFATLADELFGGFDRARVGASLEAVVRIHAVQEVTPSAAVGFVLAAREAARAVARAGDSGPVPESLDALDSRIETMLLMAFDLFERAREQIHAIAARDARRRVWALERMLAARGDLEAPPDDPGGGDQL